MSDAHKRLFGGEAATATAPDPSASTPYSRLFGQSEYTPPYGELSEMMQEDVDTRTAELPLPKGWTKEDLDRQWELEKKYRIFDRVSRIRGEALDKQVREAFDSDKVFGHYSAQEWNRLPETERNRLTVEKVTQALKDNVLFGENRGIGGMMNPKNLKEFGQGVMEPENWPWMAGTAAAPFTGGMSLLGAAGTIGGASAAGRLAQGVATGEPAADIALGTAKEGALNTGLTYGLGAVLKGLGTFMRGRPKPAPTPQLPPDYTPPEVVADWDRIAQEVEKARIARETSTPVAERSLGAVRQVGIPEVSPPPATPPPVAPPTEVATAPKSSIIEVPTTLTPATDYRPPKPEFRGAGAWRKPTVVPPVSGPKPALTTREIVMGRQPTPLVTEPPAGTQATTGLQKKPPAGTPDSFKQMPPERKPLTRAPKKETPDIEDWWTEGHKEAVKARAGAVEVATDPQEYKHAIEPNDTLRILKEIWGRGNEASVTSIGRQKPKGYVPGSAGETAFFVKMQAVPKSWAPTEAKKALVGGERGAATVANQERHVLTGVWSPDRGGWRSVSRDTVMKIEEPATGRIWIGAKRAPSQQIANEAQVARAKTEQVKQVQKAGRRMQEAAEQLPEPKPVGIPEVSPGEEATPALTRETMLSKLGEIMQRGGQTLKTTHTTGGIVKSLLRAGVKSIPLGAGAYTGSQIGSILGPVGAMAGGVAGGIAATGGVRATTMAVTRALSKGTAGFRALLRSLSLPRELQGPVQQIAHKVISGKIDPVIAAWTLQNLPGFSEWSEENGSRELGVYREP